MNSQRTAQHRQRRQRRQRTLSLRLLAGLLSSSLGASAARACSVCFGAPAGENPDAAGLNAGAAILLLALVLIQGGVVALFVRLAKRSGRS